jgi:hypothetical protein
MRTKRKAQTALRGTKRNHCISGSRPNSFAETIETDSDHDACPGTAGYDKQKFAEPREAVACRLSLLMAPCSIRRNADDDGDQRNEQSVINSGLLRIRPG